MSIPQPGYSPHAVIGSPAWIEVGVREYEYELDKSLARDDHGLVDDFAFPRLTGGHRMAARIRGSGDPPYVVFTAGLGCSVMESGFTDPYPLRRKVTFIELDRPGIALSGTRPDPLRPIDAVTIADECGEALRQICDAKGFSAEDLTLVTHSFSGNVAPSLIERAPNQGLRFTRWLDCDGSTPEHFIDPLETASMFDGMTFPAYRCCAEGGSAIRTTPTGELIFHNGKRALSLGRLAGASPIDLVRISQQVRTAVLPPGLRYCRLTRHRIFHPRHSKVTTTPEVERDWYDQGRTTAVQPSFRSTIGMITVTPLMVGGRKAIGFPPGAS